MPPHPPHRPHHAPSHHPHRHVPSSEISAFIDPDRIDALLRPWVPDEPARAFVVRCLLEEGPAHHRGANFVLLSLLEAVLTKLGGPREQSGDEPTVAVPMRLPPHLARKREPASYPLTMPLAPLTQLAPEGSRELDAMIDCLSDGPPQHALANAAMVRLLGEILARLDTEASPG